MAPSSSEPNQPNKASEQNQSASPGANGPPSLPETNTGANLEVHPQSSPPATGHYPGHHAPPHYHQPTHHPHSMGYPPVMGYPPGHPPPPSYNHNYSSPYHNYSSAPQGSHPGHAGYYPNPNYMPQQMQPVRQSGFACSNFARGVITVIIILIVISIISSVVEFFVYRHMKEPVFRLASFSVINFNITNAVLTGRWEAKVIIENPNDKVKASFDRFESFVYHQDSADVLAWNTEPPFNLDRNANTTMTLRNSMINSAQPKRSVVDEIDKERQAGSVNFGLMMKALLGYQSDTPMAMLESLKIICEDIKVGFTGGSTDGILAIDKPRDCSVST